MIYKVLSASVQGVDATIIEVEVAVRPAQEDRTIIVGLPDTAVRESSERVNFALSSCGFYKQDGAHVVNLAPADLKKEGPSFDLPIALGMAACGLQLDLPEFGDYLFAGELSLDGTLRPIKGVLALSVAAKEAGKRAILLPVQNAKEAALISDLEVYGASSLAEAWKHLVGESPLPRTQAHADLSVPPVYDVDFADVKGQAHVKRALEIAAAGGHNVRLSGAPGTGKSMIAQRISTILPPLAESEIIETTKVYSVSGLTNKGVGYVNERPFRAPHHTISDAGLLGGGSVISPGEVSLANHGVLFLDEFPEFKRSTLEALRGPLEDRAVTISRASGSLKFPSKFILVAAMNPCPCGFYGDAQTPCKCTPRQLENYQGKLSGPILDRIDIHLDVPRVDYRELSSDIKTECSASIRERVVNARNIQQHRYQALNDSGLCNALASNKSLMPYCQLNAQTHAMLEKVMMKFGYSGRAHNRILKVARTIADLAGEADIQFSHVAEAIQLRSRIQNEQGAQPSKVRNTRVKMKGALVNA